jgi:hypothetical protein
VIVNETLARRSPGKGAVGQSISLGRQSACIVGVVAGHPRRWSRRAGLVEGLLPAVPALEQRVDGLLSIGE